MRVSLPGLEFHMHAAFHAAALFPIHHFKLSLCPCVFYRQLACQAHFCVRLYRLTAAVAVSCCRLFCAQGSLCCLLASRRRRFREVWVDSWE